jgi:hypothetical protein
MSPFFWLCGSKHTDGHTMCGFFWLVCPKNLTTDICSFSLAFLSWNLRRLLHGPSKYTNEMFHCLLVFWLFYPKISKGELMFCFLAVCLEIATIRHMFWSSGLSVSKNGFGRCSVSPAFLSQNYVAPVVWSASLAQNGVIEGPCPGLLSSLSQSLSNDAKFCFSFSSVSAPKGNSEYNHVLSLWLPL